MKINSIKINKFCGFDSITCNFGTKTIIAGKIGTGKTSILKLLRMCLSDNFDNIKTMRNKNSYDNSIEIEISVLGINDEPDTYINDICKLAIISELSYHTGWYEQLKKDIISLNKPIKIKFMYKDNYINRDTITREILYDDEPISNYIRKVANKYKNGNEYKNSRDIKYQSINYIVDNGFIDNINYFRDTVNNDYYIDTLIMKLLSHVCTFIMLPEYVPINETLKMSEFFSDNTNNKIATINKKHINPNFTSRYNLFMLKNKNDKVYKKIKKNYSKFENNDFEIEIVNKGDIQEYICYNVGFDECSHGEYEIIFMLYEIFAEETNKIYFIDEPCARTSPYNKITLTTILNKLPNTQLIISTHDTEMITKKITDIIYLNNHSIVHHFDVYKVSSNNKLMNILFANIQFLFAPKILFVEGPYDRIFVQQVINVCVDNGYQRLSDYMIIQLDGEKNGNIWKEILTKFPSIKSMYIYDLDRLIPKKTISDIKLSDYDDEELRTKAITILSDKSESLQNLINNIKMEQDERKKKYLKQTYIVIGNNIFEKKTNKNYAKYDKKINTNKDIDELCNQIALESNEFIWPTEIVDLEGIKNQVLDVNKSKIELNKISPDEIYIKLETNFDKTNRVFENKYLQNLLNFLLKIS